MKKIKNENQILIMLAFFSISVGLWGNFRQLWLQDNNFAVTNISNILSIGTLISVVIIGLIGKYVKLDKLKNALVIVLLVKFINMFWLCFINNTSSVGQIKLSIIIDIVTEYIIITSIYPLITTIVKTGTIYSKRRLTEYLFRDVGILFGGVFIGKSIAGLLINYNVCLFIANVFLMFSLFILLNIKVNKATDNDEHEEVSSKYIFKDKLLILYLVYTLIGTIAMSTALGLKMLTLTNYFNFSDSVATNYLLVIGLLADIFGIIALKYLTPKNDYLTVTIKFGIRFLGYVIAFVSNNIAITLIAITWSIFISTAYENICDAVYINRLENKYQLSFSNVCHITRFLGEAIGVFLCGLMYEKGLRYMFGLSALFMVFQISLAYYMIYLRKNGEKISSCNKGRRNMKKLLVSDYDQTFYINDEDIEKNKIAVNEFRNQGNIFVIATGRSYYDFIKKKQQYNIEYDYIIINHGATILEKNDNIIFNETIPNEILNNLKSDLYLENAEKYFCCSLLESRVSFEHKNLTKVHVKYSNLEYSNEIQRKLEEKYGDILNIYYVSGNSIEIISKNTNKSKAIKLLSKKLEIRQEEIYTIGDGYSDIKMVKDYNGYAMKESVKELKDIAIKEINSVSNLIEEIKG